MQLQYRLLDHPFYKAWTTGEITKEQLANYANAYEKIISLMPAFWHKIVDSNRLNDFDRRTAEKIITEEESHIQLWDEWTGGLPAPKEVDIQETLDSLNALNRWELAGAIHAFELQQPEVAKTKRDCLIEHYGKKPEELSYFESHINEHEHIEFGRNIYEKYAHQEDFERGFSQGSKIFYDNLNLFM